jgi:preprotein translocase subunit SecG
MAVRLLLLAQLVLLILETVVVVVVLVQREVQADQESFISVEELKVMHWQQPKVMV